MNKKLVLPLVGLAVVFFILALVFFFSRGKEKSVSASAEASSGIDDAVAAETVDLKLFYMESSDWRLIPITVRVPRPAIRTELYREFLRLLLQQREDHRAPIPAGVTLRALYFVEADRILVVDFNQDLIINFPGGSRAELEFIRFIVNNICYNFREIRSVRFMIAGNEAKTLGGHIDLSRPFLPDFSDLKQDEQ
ncbi:MAG: GerMN domain-containing protein [Acidobacteriota bacterium]|jgi:hypothetical protein|nr:GerMN domain-containing protein [Acidobacteriota bacterium]